VTRNPWRLDRNTSGSSSGAAAAAAAGYAPLHIGTDIGGSVRLPATHCGIFALKPSLGRIPVLPPYMGRVAADDANGDRRRHADGRAVQAGCARFHEPAVRRTEYAKNLESIDARKLKIGFLPDMRAGLAVHEEVHAAAQAAAKALGDAARWWRKCNPLTTEMLDGVCRFFEGALAHDFMQLAPQKQAKVLPFIAEWCTWRAARFTGREVMQAVHQVMAMREAAVAACQRFDYVVSPVSPILPYPAEEAAPGKRSTQRAAALAFTVPYNMSEQPRPRSTGARAATPCRSACR